MTSRNLKKQNVQKMLLEAHEKKLNKIQQQKATQKNKSVLSFIQIRLANLLQLK